MSAQHYEGALKEELSDKLKADGVQYAVTIGRRSPMHEVHLDCIQEIADAGLTPVVVVGSTNGSGFFRSRQ